MKSNNGGRWLLASVLAVWLATGCSASKSKPESGSALYLAANTANYDQHETDDDFLDFTSDGTRQTAPSPKLSDPLTAWNRTMFLFNDKLFYWVLKPMATGYKKVVPEIARTGIKNFFYNLAMPGRFFNCVLQGKGEKALHELGGFMVNSTLGGLGFGNPAKSHFKVSPSPEDLGQTLAVYGVHEGCYIVWPVFGPSTLRDTIAIGGQYWMDPLFYIDIPWEAAGAMLVIDKINDVSFVIDNYQAIHNASLDPYEAFRDIYLQYRRNQIQD